MSGTENYSLLQHNKRNIFALILSILSLVFLIPGVALSMLNISTTGAVAAPLVDFDINFFDTTNSILSTVARLFEQDYYFVSIMIFIFSVIVPTAKITLLIQMIVIHSQETRKKLLRVAQTIGKWSMCDVFIVAVFLSYLSTGSKSSGETHEGSLLGIPFDINVKVDMHANLEIGFYCFLSYCLLSLVASQLFTVKPHPSAPEHD